METKKKSRGRKTGFTLVELLAVIVILAIILVIAVPKVMSVIEDSKKATLESTAKMIASQAEKQKVQNTVLGNDKKITCKDITNINDVDYADCDIVFDNNTAKVTITGGGKFEGLNICDGTKTSAEATTEECKSTPPVLNCTYDGELVQGAEFIHNQYTYRYMQEFDGIEWYNIGLDGWGVILTDKTSTDPVNTPICTYINGKPLVSTTSMFLEFDMNTYKKILSQSEVIDVSLWNTSTVTNMSGMFEGSAATSLDLSNFDTSNVTIMSGMFSESAATSLDLSSFDTSNVTYMAHMFSGSAATSLDLSSFDTSNVTNMLSMFRDTAATTLDLSSFDTSNVTYMGSMFEGSAATSLDLSSFDTSNVTDMGSTFLGSAATSLDLSSFDTSNVTDMIYMFYESAATSLDLSSFNTSNVTRMSGMFEGSAATSLDLSSFDTSKVTNTEYMFRESAATTIYVGNNWNTSNVTYHGSMFENATNLVGGNGTTYNSSYIDKTYARVDTASTPGYFTYKASN